MSLNEIVLDAVDQLWEKAAGAGSRVAAHVPDTECVTMGDRMMLTRAVANLIDNGLKYGPAGTDVHCTLGSEDGAWLIGVEDTGAESRRSSARPRPSRSCSSNPRTAARGGFGLGPRSSARRRGIAARS